MNEGRETALLIIIEDWKAKLAAADLRLLDNVAIATKHIAELEAKLDNLRGCNQQLQEKLKGKDVKIGHLAEEITGLTEIVKQNYNRAADAEAKLAELKELITEKDSSISAHSNMLSDRYKHITELEAKLAELSGPVQRQILAIITDLQAKLAAAEKDYREDMAIMDAFHEKDVKRIAELEAKLEAAEDSQRRTQAWAVENSGECNVKDRRIAELEAEREHSDVEIKELRVKNREMTKEILDYQTEVQRLTAAAACCFSVEHNGVRYPKCTKPSGVGNDPKCTCSTCAHELGPSREDKDKEACKACGPAVVNHGTHPLWKSRDKQSAPESPDGRTGLCVACIELGGHEDCNFGKNPEQCPWIEKPAGDGKGLCPKCGMLKEAPPGEHIDTCQCPAPETPEANSSDSDGNPVHLSISAGTPDTTDGPSPCKYQTADCQTDDCTDCDKQNESKEAKK